jgi:hypothetical protein
LQKLLRQCCPSVAPRVKTVIAVQHIRRMRGGAQSHLMRCSDDHFYVVKFQNNPQHRRVLVNEMLASKLAVQIGLPVPVSVIVEVDDSLLERTPELHIQLAHQSIPCQAGRQFGSEYAVSPLSGQCFDYLPTETLGGVSNLARFCAMLVLDKWTGNTDARQVVFWRENKQSLYTAAFIDQGYCFNAGEWTFPDIALQGVYRRNEVYESVRGWSSFLASLQLIEKLEPDIIRSIAHQIPGGWYDSNFSAFGVLVELLVDRRTMIRPLIDAFRKSERNPFPHWRDN